MHPKATKTRNRQVEFVRENKDERLYAPNYAKDSSIRGSNWAAVGSQVWSQQVWVLGLTPLMASSLLSEVQYLSSPPEMALALTEL